MRLRVWIVVLWFAWVNIAPLFAPFDPYLTDPVRQLQSPSTTHLFGTDMLGRDVFSRMLYGGQRTLWIALIAASIGIVAGISVGLMSGKWTDRVIGALLDALFAIPGIVLSLVMLTLVGGGAGSIALAVGMTQIAPMAQVTRTAVRVVLQADYVTAAHMLGGQRRWITLRHILPNITPTLAAYAGVVISYCLLNAAALTFLGFGGDPSVPDWGGMLYEGRAAFRSAYWIALFPGAAITFTVLLLQWAARTIPRE